jgi:nuclear RNA export factor
VFFVLGLETADALKAISRKISAPSGHKLIVVVNRSAIPPTPIDEELTNTIKLVMSQRYDANNKVMDLSRLREDSNLQSLGLYVSLSRPNMLNTVITIIIENTADIVGLNLKDNKLSSLEPLVKLANVCEALKAIDLSQNQVLSAEFEIVIKLDF